MNPYIECEIHSLNRNLKFDVKLIKFNRKHIFTSIPKEQKNTKFEKDELLIIRYFFGEFSYEIHAFFEKKESIYNVFNIYDITISNNFRKERRENVFVEAIYWDQTDMKKAKILDISQSGLRMETHLQIPYNSIEIHYIHNNEMHYVKGRIKWEKNLNNSFQYGIEFI